MSYDSWKTEAPPLDGNTHTGEGEPLATHVSEPLMYVRLRLNEELKTIDFLMRDIHELSGAGLTFKDLTMIASKACVVRRAADGIVRAIEGVVEDDIRF